MTHSAPTKNGRQRARTFRPLSGARSAATLRLHHLMEERQRIEIGQRIKDLRNGSPQTNRSIADFVGVGERAVANWIAGGGIAWENAKRVADLFDVDAQWLWSGRGSREGGDGLRQLDADYVREALGEIRADVKDVLVRLDAQAAAQAARGAGAPPRDAARERQRKARGRRKAGPEADA